MGQDKPTVGVLGSGDVGRALATAFRAEGHAVTLGSRDRDPPAARAAERDFCVAPHRPRSTMDPIVHFEIPADDLDRARTFYQDVFDWKTDAVPGMDYTMIFTTSIGEDRRPTTPGAINGGMLKRQDPVQSPVITVNVDDIEAALERVAEGGGEVLGEPQPVGDMGIAAYFRDPEGNVLGLWQALGGPQE